jgi:hypothetical protein
MSGETDEKSTKVFRNFGVLARRPCQHREDGADACSGYNRGQPACARFPVLAPNDKVAEPTSRFLMAARAALR